MFSVALFMIAPNCKQPRYPSASEWLNQIVLHYYQGFLLSNTWEQTIGTSKKLDDFLRVILMLLLLSHFNRVRLCATP